MKYTLELLDTLNRVKSLTDAIYDRKSGYTEEFDTKSLNILRTFMKSLGYSVTNLSTDKYGVKHSYLKISDSDGSLYIDVTIDKLDDSALGIGLSRIDFFD